MNSSGRLTLQARWWAWLCACFEPKIRGDLLERLDRVAEENLELLQSLGYPKERYMAMGEFVYGRPPGHPPQEFGGAVSTLYVLAEHLQIDMDQCAEDELARVWTKIDVIRAKQDARPSGAKLLEYLKQ